MRPVCSAGLAMTALPAASAAATCPVKIASGKLHGEMQRKTPRPCSEISLRSPVGPGSGKIGRAHVRTPVTNAHLVCRLLLEKTKALKKTKKRNNTGTTSHAE